MTSYFSILRSTQTNLPAPAGSGLVSQHESQGYHDLEARNGRLEQRSFFGGANDVANWPIATALRQSPSVNSGGTQWARIVRRRASSR